METKTLFRRIKTKEGYVYEPVDMEEMEKVLYKMENHISGEDCLWMFAYKIRNLLK